MEPEHKRGEDNRKYFPSKNLKGKPKRRSTKLTLTISLRSGSSLPGKGNTQEKQEKHLKEWGGGGGLSETTTQSGCYYILVLVRVFVTFLGWKSWLSVSCRLEDNRLKGDLLC